MLELDPVQHHKPETSLHWSALAAQDLSPGALCSTSAWTVTTTCLNTCVRANDVWFSEINWFLFSSQLKPFSHPVFPSWLLVFWKPTKMYPRWPWWRPSCVLFKPGSPCLSLAYPTTLSGNYTAAAVLSRCNVFTQWFAGSSLTPCSEHSLFFSTTDFFNSSNFHTAVFFLQQ